MTPIEFDMIEVAVTFIHKGVIVTGTTINLPAEMRDEIGARVHDAIERRLTNGDKSLPFRRGK